MRERRVDPGSGSWTVFEDPAEPSEACRLCGLPGDGFAVVEEVADAVGASELVAHAPDHEATLLSLGPQRLEQAIHVWADRYAALGARREIGYALVHATLGGERGTHPHSRIDAYPEIPPVPRVELQTARDHLIATGRCVFCDIVSSERSGESRVVAANYSFLAFVPYAARVPHEVHVMAQRHAASLVDLTDAERTALARLLHDVLGAYEQVVESPNGYTLAIHQAPTDDGQWQSVSHFHVELLPALPAPDLAAGAHLNPVAPERSAELLRAAVPG